MEISKTQFNIAQTFLQALPFSSLLKMKMEQAGEGFAVISMPYQSIVSDGSKDEKIYSSAISSLIDTCGGLSVLVHKHLPRDTATLDLRVDYLRTACPGETVFARAECYYVADSVAFVKATATDNCLTDPIASAVGTFAFVSKKPVSI